MKLTHHKWTLKRVSQVALCLSHCCNGCTLLAKAHVCLPAPEETIYPGCYTNEGASEDAEPTPSGQTQPYDVPLTPTLPGVDPKIVDALEKVLKECGEPGLPKLIVLPEPAGDAEQQEEPLSQWPLVPPEKEMPSLYLPLETDELDLYEDGPVGSVKSDDSNAAAVLQTVLEALQHGLYVDVSGVDPESDELEVSCTVRVGGLECHVVVDGSGHRYGLIGLLPEATGDLKAMQQALYERVQHWIAVMNGPSSPVEEEAEDGAREDLTDEEPWGA